MSSRESFTYSSYVIMGKKPSQIVEGYEHDVEIGVGCPRCRVVNLPIDHLEERDCVNCGLHMQRKGNSLEVWIGA